MRLVTVHKLLIAASLALCALFAASAVWMYARDGRAAHLVVVPLALAVGAGLSLYLRSFLRRTRARQQAPR